MPDDYQYQVKPLPRKQVIGESATSASQVSVDSPPNFPFGSEQQITPPYGGAPGGGGGGGGGGGTPTCATSWSIGAIGTNSVSLPCSGGVQATLTDSGLEITSGSKTLLIELDGSNNQFFIDQGSKSVRMDPDDLEEDGPDAAFRILDVPHMGALGKRGFFASEAYPA